MRPITVRKKAVQPSAPAPKPATPVVAQSSSLSDDMDNSEAAAVPAAVPERSPASAVRAGAAKPRYMPYGDAARVLGTVAVVIGHVCDMAVFNARANPTDWWVCNIVDSACRWAVPVYIMLSGSLLLDPARAELPGQFYKKRMARLGLPILFWSAFFMLFSYYYTHWVTTPGELWQNLALGKPYAHLHFIFRIAGLYAFTPMLRVFLQHASRRMVTLTAVLLLSLSAGNSIIDGCLGYEQSFFLRFAPFLGFYITGYLMRDMRVSRRTLRGCWVLAAACVFILAGGTGLLLEVFGKVNHGSWIGYPSLGFLLYDFVSPVRIALAIAAWIILINAFDDSWLNSDKGKFVSKWLAPATLGIYLVHPFFREVLYTLPEKLGADWPRIGPTWPNVWCGILLVSLMVYLPSVIFTLVVMRIPGVRRVVG